MPKQAPDVIARRIGELGVGFENSVSEAIFTALCQRPTLVYISFWDGDSLAAHRPSPFPQHKFGGVPYEGVDCIVENYETAFAPLLVCDKERRAKRLYERVRTRRPAHVGSARPLSLYEIRDTGVKPIDYYFLENFHITNIRNPWKIDQTLTASPSKSQDVNWWPHFIVRLEEIWEAMRYRDLSVNSDESQIRSAFELIFGILAYSSVQLQDYLILINNKTADKRVLEDYKCFRDDIGDDEDIIDYNRELLQAIKSHDFDEKLPNDITFAHLKDFNGSQACRAKEVEKFWAALNTVPGLNPPKAYFVRWKTAEEVEEEAAGIGSMPVKGSFSGYVPTTIKEVARSQPVLGFTQQLEYYIANLSRKR